MFHLKPITALIIVFLGQSNFFSHRYSYFVEKFSYKKNELEKEDKKTIAKQGVTRFSDNSKLGEAKVFLKNYFQNIQTFAQLVNFFTQFTDVTKFAFNKSRLMLFGCCWGL